MNSLDIGIKDFFKNFLLFSILTPDELKFIVDFMDILELEAGEVLFKEGDPGDFMCIVLNGGLEVIKETSWKDEAKVVATLGTGNTIGEMSLIDHTPRSATVRAVTNSRLAGLSQRVFDTIMNDKPRIGVKVLKGLAMTLSENLRDTSGRLADEMAS